jgi:hypothetical protein
MLAPQALGQQRVQIPSSAPAWGTTPYPDATIGGYPNVTPYPAAAPAYGAPGVSPVGPPPTFDPYAPPSVSGTTLGPPPPSLPYNYSAPGGGFPATPANPWQGTPPPAGGFPPGMAPQQPLYPDGLPFDWQQGTYGYQAKDGSLVRFQKFLQRIGFEHTWLAGGDDPEDFELNRTELAATFGIPVMHNLDSPLLVTPGFAFNFLEGPQGDPNPPMMDPRGPDLPGQLYDAYLDLSWYPRPFEWFGAELGFRTGVWSDFDNVGSDSVRFLGRGLAVISVSPQLDVLIGVVYLDRMDVQILPAGGFHYRPNDVWDMYIVFPNPKIRRRFRSLGNTDWWWYVAGEYGGGSWTVNRSGLDDRIDYNDIRFVTGLEWELPNKVRGHVEVGYVFDREILFESGMPNNADLNDTVMIRAGIDF